MIKIKEKFKAFTLIEVILVVAGIALLTIIAFNFYKKVEAKRIAKQEADLVLAAVSELRSQFPSGRTPFNRLARLNTYPSNRIIKDSGSAFANSGIYMPWKDGYAYTQLTGYDETRANSGSLIKFEIANMPKEVCLNFIPKVINVFGRVEVIRNGSTCGRSLYHVCLIKNDYVVTEGMYPAYGNYYMSTYKDNVSYDSKKIIDACSVEHNGSSLKTVKLYLK